MKGSVELKGLALKTDIGTYKLDDVVPSVHFLDLHLTIGAKFVFIERDSMSLVFDYDPLVADIISLAADGHFETQERLATKIAFLCSEYEQIVGASIFLGKSPVSQETGTLGVRLELDAADLVSMRS